MTDTLAPPLEDFTPLDGLKSAFDWWADAGVDNDFTAEPTGWLAKPVTERAPTPPPPAPPAPERPTTPLQRALDQGPAETIGGQPSDWPGNLAEFHAFWMAEPSLAGGTTSGRVAPMGNAGADLMVIVGQPDEEDRDIFLSGQQGAMFRSFAKAAGIDSDRVYLASALPRRTALPDWEALAEAGLRQLTQHHVALAAPKRVLVFGRGPASLLGEEAGTPLLRAPAFENLARSAGRRKRFWTQWLDWTA